MSVFGGPDIVTDGLVLHLDAANRKSYPGSGTTWYDLSGNGSNATRYNSSFTGDAFSFDGNTDYFLVGNVGSNSVKTVSCWFTMDNVDTQMALFGFGTVATNTQDIYMWGADSNGAFGFNHWNGDSWGFAGGEDLIKNNGYFNVVAEFNFSDYTSNRLWLNGTLKTLSNQRGTNLQRSQSNNFGIGINGWNSVNQTWAGDISIVSVYDRPTTTNEVLTNYNALKGRYGL